MKYYSADSTDNIDVIGHYPQTRSMLAYNPDGENSFRKVRWNEFADFVPQYKVEIHPEANVTNFLERSPLPFGFLIDELFLEVLKSHKLPDYRAYKVEVFHNNKSLEYYWFHFVFDMWHYLEKDLSRVIVYQKISGKTLTEHSFESRDNLASLKKSLNFEKGMQIKEVVFDESAAEFDLLAITDFFHIPLISQRLKDDLHLAGLNGFETQEYDRIKFL